jgi:prepilin-type processing-associated H-X9-DG protein
VGLDRLSKRLTGQGTRVSINGDGEVTPEHAQAVLDGKHSGLTRAAFPSDAFDVYVTYVPLAQGSRQLTVYGQWDWRDDFVGQAAPEDIASLQFSYPDCVRHGNLAANTGMWDGSVTNRATLRDAGVSSKAPIWNIHDGTSGFANLTDNGCVTSTLNAANCTVGGPAQVGIAFAYEANRGGSVVSVSAGFGALSVGYSNQGDVLRKSSQPIYGAL